MSSLVDELVDCMRRAKLTRQQLMVNSKLLRAADDENASQADRDKAPGRNADERADVLRAMRVYWSEAPE